LESITVEETAELVAPVPSAETSLMKAFPKTVSPDSSLRTPSFALSLDCDIHRLGAGREKAALIVLGNRVPWIECSELHMCVSSEEEKKRYIMGEGAEEKLVATTRNVLSLVGAASAVLAVGFWPSVLAVAVAVGSGSILGIVVVLVLKQF